jgi:hypothetical protein
MKDLKDKFEEHLKSTILSDGRSETTIKTIARRMAQEAEEHFNEINPYNKTYPWIPYESVQVLKICGKEMKVIG